MIGMRQITTFCRTQDAVHNAAVCLYVVQPGYLWGALLHECGCSAQRGYIEWQALLPSCNSGCSDDNEAWYMCPTARGAVYVIMRAE